MQAEVVELKKITKEINNLIEIESPKYISTDAIDNWYKQSAWIKGLRNVIEEYFLDLNRFFNYREHESFIQTAEEIH